MGTSRLRRLSLSSRTLLRTQIEEVFDLDGIRLLCADLGVDYENLSGVTKSTRVLGLVEHVERNSRVSELAERCAFLRPALDWTTTFESDKPASAVTEELRTTMPNAWMSTAANTTVLPETALIAIPACEWKCAMGHQIKVAAFLMDKFPVTNADYARYVQAHPGTKLPAYWQQGRPVSKTDDHPVVGVNVNMAMSYAQWAGRRLPTADEWLAAAGYGVTQRQFPWGDVFDFSKCNCEQVHKGTTAVTRFPEGASPHGVLDVAGNAWEWTIEEVAPRGFSQGRAKQVAKGGSWRSQRRQLICVAEIALWPETQQDDVGFRCAK